MEVIVLKIIVMLAMAMEVGITGMMEPEEEIVAVIPVGRGRIALAVQAAIVPMMIPPQRQRPMNLRRHRRPIPVVHMGHGITIVYTKVVFAIPVMVDLIVLKGNVKFV